MIHYFKAIKLLYTSLNKYLFLIANKNLSLLKTLKMYNYNYIYSHINIPSFNNSAMDGYAIKYTKQNIQNIKILKKLKAGENPKYFKYKKNYAIKIMTGAKVPSYFNTVIKIEDTTVNNNCLILHNTFKKGDNIRLIGEDFKKNNLILNKCSILNMNNIMVLSSFGIKNINIIKPPFLFLLATGSEIIDKSKKYNSKFLVYNSSTPYIKMFLQTLGYKIKYLGLIQDNEIKFINKIKNIITLNYFSIIITTGAVSKGDYDFIPKILKKLGIKTIFHSINIKPGKPILTAKYKKHIYFFSLPGNPISSIIGLRFFIYPFINYFLSQHLEIPVNAKLVNNINITIKKTTFLKAYSFINKTKVYVKILKNQESFKIKPLLISNCFVFLKKNDIIKKNKIMNIYFYNPHTII